jgi:hypothetical protein
MKGFILALVLSAVSLVANAALIGRLPITLGGTDYQAYYDDIHDLTWLTDANAAVGTIYDIANPGLGYMEWDTADAVGKQPKYWRYHGLASTCIIKQLPSIFFLY